MNNHFKTSPVVLFLVDGFGLSPSWQGNAIASAKPANFNKFWSSYRHLVIRQQLLNPANPHKNYSLISVGGNSNTKKPLELFSSQDFICNLDSLNRNNASIHFLLIFSKKDKTAQKNILQIIKTAKSNSVANAYLHLFIDDSYLTQSDLQPDIDDFESQLASIGLGNIATVTGLNYVKKENFNDILDSVYFVQGSAVFSLKQALTRKNNLRPFETATRIIKSSFNAKINDFDMVFAMSSPSEHFSDFLKTIIIQNNACGNGKFPKFLQFFGLDEFPFDLENGIHFINPKKQGCFITDFTKQKGLSQVIVTDDDNLKQMNHYFIGDKSQIDQSIVEGRLNPTTKKVESTTEAIIAHALIALKKNMYDFIIINLPSLCRAESFVESVEEVKKIDDGLGLVASQVISQNGFLVFCSAFGRAENLVENTNKLRDNTEACGAEQVLPFFVLANSTKKVSKLDLFHETLSASCGLEHVNDFLQTILLKDNYQDE